MAEKDPSAQDPFEHTRMTLGDHLNELRKRLIRGLIALGIALVIGFTIYQPAGRAFLWPMRTTLEWVNRDQVEKYEKRLAEDPSLARSSFFLSDDPADKQLKPELTVTRRFVMTRPGEGFAYAMKVATIVAFALGAPILLWQMWGFIAAGLYEREKRAVLRYFPISVALFLAGVAFGFFVMMPYTSYFLVQTFPVEEVQYLPSLESYMDLLTSLTLILGGVFQLPIVMYALIRLGIVERSTFVKYRRHFIVATFVMAGILTPPDPYTQSMMAIPMLLLYESALFFTRFVGKPGARKA